MINTIVLVLGYVALVVILFSIIITGIAYIINKMWKIRKGMTALKLLQDCIKFSKENSPELAERIKKLLP